MPLTPPNRPHSILVGISGASGAQLALNFLKSLKQQQKHSPFLIELILSKSALQSLTSEKLQKKDFLELADIVHSNDNIGASVASGSYPCQAMFIIPCSVTSFSKLASGISDNLIIRAADVMLKEKRPLILVPRECPLHQGHLESLARCAQLGASIYPPMPLFYHNPQSLEEIYTTFCHRLLDSIGLAPVETLRWQGMNNI